MKNDITLISINAPLSRVWEALITPEIISQYFFGTHTQSDWKAGSPIRFSGEWEGKKYEDKGTILEIDPGNLLRYDYWSSMSGIGDKPENYMIVTYMLNANDAGTTLSVTQENIPNEQMKQHSEQNWNMVLSSLKQLLEKE
jgi:uncharacterized protein YndB with AHSA1/START domain